MILYLTSSNGGSLLDETSACAEAACGLFGSPHNHLCFTAEPLAGRGPFVHTIDLPMEEAKRYEIKNEFRSPSARFYAVPLEVLRGLPIKEDTFEAVTGRKWNEWVLPVLDRRDVPKGSKVRGKWAMVWASREGIASVRVHRKLEGRGQTVYLSVQVTTTSDFDPATDYIVLEEHTESERDGGGVKETWRLETLAGTTPQWVIFPKAWQEFVWSPAVADSAADFILNLAPDAWEEVTLGRKKGSKADKARAWRRASSDAGGVDAHPDRPAGQ